MKKIYCCVCIMHDFKVGTVYKYKDEKIEKKLVFIGYMEVESFVTEPLGIDEILGYYGGMIVETKEKKVYEMDAYKCRIYAGRTFRAAF